MADLSRHRDDSCTKEQIISEKDFMEFTEKYIIFCDFIF